jgi:GNAT superfamily N-acetyltransferase
LTPARIAGRGGDVAGSASMTEARPADTSDITPIGGALARAFHDDPVMTWLFGEREAARRRRLARFMTAEARRHHRHGSLVLTADGHRGAAFWNPPDRWRTTWPELLRQSPMMLRALGVRIPRALRGLGLIERTHPREPHWYLAMLGTDPPHQGKGVGAALMAPVTDRCDAEGLGAYLESSKEANLAYYERFGFRVTGRIDLPGGPPLWPMWRDPR